MNCMHGFREEIKTAEDSILKDPAFIGLLLGATGGGLAAKKAGTTIQKLLQAAAKAGKKTAYVGGPLAGASIGTLFGLALRKPALSKNAKDVIKQTTLSSNNVYGQNNVHSRY